MTVSVLLPAEQPIQGGRTSGRHWADWPAWSAYVVGGLLLALAQVLRSALDIPVGSQTGIMFLMPPVISAAVLGGMIPGLLATAIAVSLSSGFLAHPADAALLDWVRLASFIMAGLLSSALCDALRRARRRTETEALRTAVTLASIGDAVITTDTAGAITLMNEAAERLTGWTATEAIGQDLAAVYRIRPEEGSPPPGDPVQRALHTEVAASLCSHLILRTRSGTDIFIEDSAAPIRAPDGGLIGVVLVFRDCSERKRHELELREQVERYMRLMEVSPDAILVNREGRIAMANVAALRLFGAQRTEDLIGKQPQALFHPAFHQIIRDRIALLLQGQPVSPMEERIVRLDGGTVDVEVQASPFEDRGTRCIHVVLRDITARKAAERELRQWADAFTHCAHGIALSHPPTGTVVACNPAFAQMLGRSVEDMAGAPIFGLYHPSQIDMVNEQIRVAESGGHARYDALMLRKDGSTFPAQMDLVTIRDAGGALLYRVATMQDITARKAAEEEVQRLNASLERTVEERTAELRAANQELDAFTYAVSHDLRAPLRAMSGFSQALIEDYGQILEGEGRIYLDQIIQASKRMGELVEGLLVLSRTTRHEVQRGTVDLTAIAERIVNDLSKSDPTRQVVWRIAPGLAAHGDPRMLEILLDNLLNNAWKYTANTPDAQISLAVEHMPEGPEFVVSDNGAGFDMAHAGKLFQPFQRLHRQDEFPGIGIGLATVQRVVNRHGGTITGSGVPGVGATFRFTLAPPASPASEFL